MADISAERYVSFTTFRTDGTPVATPVWIAPLGNGTAGFTTDATSGKAKRLAHNTAVTLRPCDARGRVPDGAPTVDAIATVVSGADAAAVAAAIRRKYVVLGNALWIVGRVTNLWRRQPSTAVVITLPR
jgi:uncharacterized protein